MSVTTNLAFPSQPTINSRFLDWVDAGRFPIHEFQSGGAFNRFGKALFFILSSWEIIRKKNILPRHTYHIFSKFEAPFAISAGDICYPISEGEVERLYPLIVRMEDRRFREHLGLDGRAFIRAIVRNACTLSLKQGGSTITQQLVRNTLISGERSFLRKVVEAILAVKIERHYSKEEIFRLYCECVYLGRGCRGFQAASKTIYRRPLQKLSDPELVSLIGLLRAPNFYHPLSDQKAFQRRANFVSGVVDKIDPALVSRTSDCW